MKNRKIPNLEVAKEKVNAQSQALGVDVNMMKRRRLSS